MRLNLITTLAGIVVLLFISLSVQTCRVNKINEQRDIAEADKASALQFANNEKNKTETYVNKFNNSVSKTKALELSLSNTNALLENERLAHLKEFEGLNKKISNLEQSIAIDASINADSIPFRTVYVPCKDSIRVFHYQLIDKYNTISAMVLDTPQFDIKVPIRSVVYWQRKTKILWFRVGRKEHFIESTSPNKLVTINEQELIKVTKKK